jgi:hypothetical protein
VKKSVLAAHFLLVSLAGCMRTYRVEQYSSVNAGIASDGSTSVASHVNREERSWTGPWVVQPDQARP